MKVVCAYLLAVLGGKSSPTAADIKTILGSVGAEADDAAITKLLGELDGKDLAEVFAEGGKKLASMPSGGGGGGGGGAAAAGGGGGAAAKAKAPEPEPEEEEEADMGFDLFD